jgi:hypothetical protein
MRRGRCCQGLACSASPGVLPCRPLCLALPYALILPPPPAPQEWYLEGKGRTHPGARRRRTREEVIESHQRQEALLQGACVFT